MFGTLTWIPLAPGLSIQPDTLYLDHCVVLMYFEGSYFGTVTCKVFQHFCSEPLLALSVGQRLCINFFVSTANFLITLRSHLDDTCSCYFDPLYLMWMFTIVYIYEISS